MGLLVMSLKKMAFFKTLFFADHPKAAHSFLSEEIKWKFCKNTWLQHLPGTSEFWLRCLQTLEMTKHNSRKVLQRSTGFKCCTALMHVAKNIYFYNVEYAIFCLFKERPCVWPSLTFSNKGWRLCRACTSSPEGKALFLLKKWRWGWYKRCWWQKNILGVG